ncbi:LysR family transcriptional regulator [Amylibacter kogurei]|uniref:LysR family transcriptional regulator n=1 Tax=Paramylibacter kogurei TaxID=1889778 RepID=A0A2G5K632_9RHOB|nr:LysR family transcriptional regulator [Amylibacter kogurei]PIB24473.1 LysR family transcriptional regulator [Amylibacter kogurei]
MVDTPGKMTLWAVEIFVAAVEEGTISLAAKRLNASPSSVSQQLTNLEAGLGVLLLNRSTRPMELTSAGRLFLRRAQNILGEVTQAKAELAVFNFSKMVRLRIGVVDDFDADVTPALMAQLSKKMDGCQFLLESASSYQLAEALDSRSMDVIITADADMTEDWMDIHPLLVEPFLVVAPKGSVDQSGEVMEQLLTMPFIRYSSRTMMGRQIEAHLARQRINLPNRFEFNNYHAIMSMVADKAGWTVTTPLGYLRAHRFIESVDVMPLPFKEMTRGISLVSRKDVMDRIPQDVADLARPLLQEKLVGPCVEKLPWLRDKFKVLM